MTLFLGIRSLVRWRCFVDRFFEIWESFELGVEF